MQKKIKTPGYLFSHEKFKLNNKFLKNMYTNLHTFFGTCSMFLLVFHKNYNRYELRMSNFSSH